MHDRFWFRARAYLRHTLGAAPSIIQIDDKAARLRAAWQARCRTHRR